MSTGFVHSVKPPRLYKTAAAALRAARSGGASLDALVRDTPRRTNKKLLYNLLVETLKYESSLDDFFTETDLFNAEPRLDPWLTRVLFTELILGERELSDESKPVQVVLKYYKKYEDKIATFKNAVQENDKKEAVRPRYVRINTLRLSTADAVRNFQDEGWNLVRCTSGTYDDYLRQIENLGESDFLPDYHVKVVFAFPSKTSFSNSSSYINGEIFLQDKATCLAAHLLNPEPGSTVLDMCSAPGMKTTHIAAVMKNEGTIYSVEQDKPRSEVLCKFIETSGATCVKVINKDAARVTKEDCPNVDYILLDPSCSGSGISRIDNNNAEHDLQSGRLHKLSAFQAKLLRHALNEFRSAKRVVYSTCSLYPQENEEVVRDVIQNHKGKFKLISAKEILNNKWHNTGDLKYTDIGEKCLYAKPNSDYTSGFFIAVFERCEDVVEEKSIANKAIENNDDSQFVDNSKKSKRKEKCYKVNSESVNIDLMPKEVSEKKSKKNKSKVESDSLVSSNDCVQNDIVKNEEIKLELNTESQIDYSEIKSKKKKKNKDKDCDIPVADVESDTTKKKSKKRKIESSDVPDQLNVHSDEIISKKKKKKKRSIDE